MVFTELGFVEWLRQRQPAHRAVELGLGDDMSVVASSADRLLTSCDLLLDGVHFDSNDQPVELIGRKAIACSLSDCAAMAVRPLAATVAVALPVKMSLANAKGLYEGMWQIAGEYDLAIVGGDTTRWTHPLVIDVAITAESYAGLDPVARSGARPGDLLYVTGRLGGSLLGSHLTFVPRVAEARVLAGSLGKRLHAMIDISDGLALDLSRLCEASAVGATLEEERLLAAASDDARRASDADGKTVPAHVLGDGEDYELLFAVEGEVALEGLPLHQVGYVTASGLRLARTDGRIETLEPAGYVH